MLTWLLATAFAQDGQYSQNFQIEYFYGAAPHARVEALGRSGVLLGGSTASVFYNPAAIGTVEEGNGYLSHAAPYFALRSANYVFAGASYRVAGPWVVGLNWNRFQIGDTTFQINLGGERYPVRRPTVDNVTLTNAVRLFDGFHVGVNVNGFRWKYLDDAPNAFALHVDGGVYYEHALPTLSTGATHHIRGAVTVNNATATRITFEDPAGVAYTQAFPITLRTGVGYQITLPVSIPGAGTGPLTLLGLFEFDELLNGPIRTAFRGGAEARLYDVVAVRVGAFTDTVDDFGFENNRSRRFDVTYGFGLNVPVATLTEGRVPIEASLDYTALRPASYVFDGTRLPNRASFTLEVDWALPEAKKVPVTEEAEVAP